MTLELLCDALYVIMIVCLTYWSWYISSCSSPKVFPATFVEPDGLANASMDSVGATLGDGGNSESTGK